MGSISLRSWAVFLVLLSPLAHGGGDEPSLFGYKIGQHYKATKYTEHRLYGVIVANPARLTPELEELLLTVTPKSHTIVSIRGTLRTDDHEQIKKLKDQYWAFWKTKCPGWAHQRLEFGPVMFWKTPYYLQAGSRRTRIEGLFEFSVSLEYVPGTPERRALDALRIEEARQIVAGGQSGGP